jgi:hypothetical protein
MRYALHACTWNAFITCVHSACDMHGNTHNRYMPDTCTHIPTYVDKITYVTCWDTDVRTYVDVDAIRMRYVVRKWMYAYMHWITCVHALAFDAFRTYGNIRTHAFVRKCVRCIAWNCGTILFVKCNTIVTCHARACIPTYVNGAYVRYWDTDIRTYVDVDAHYIRYRTKDQYVAWMRYMRYTHFHYIHTFVHAVKQGCDTCIRKCSTIITKLHGHTCIRLYLHTYISTNVHTDMLDIRYICTSNMLT